MYIVGTVGVNLHGLKQAEQTEYCLGHLYGKFLFLESPHVCHNNSYTPGRIKHQQFSVDSAGEILYKNSNFRRLNRSALSFIFQWKYVGGTVPWDCRILAFSWVELVWAPKSSCWVTVFELFENATRSQACTLICIVQVTEKSSSPVSNTLFFFDFEI